MSKKCSTCKKIKPLSDFGKHKQTPTGLNYSCKSCLRDKTNKYRKENKKRFKNYRLQNQYGISIEEWQIMYDNQQGCCAVCETHQSMLKTILCVDHNHITGEIRGLLCHTCNRAMGLFKDDSMIIKKAMEYLNDSHC